MLTCREPTPIFHRPDLSQVFGTRGLLFDEKQLLRALEFIALPGTPLQIVKSVEDHEYIVQVKIDSYKSEKPLYMDSRFLLGKSEEKKAKFCRDEALEKLWNFPPCIYIWGGNFVEGIEKMITLYPPPKTLTPFEHAYWQLKGVDCSGLYYEVLQGKVPRNTSDLLKCGKEISLSHIEPLDILIWQGHMVIVLDQGKVIESRHQDGGLIIRTLQERLDMIDHPFTCRRISIVD